MKVSDDLIFQFVLLILVFIQNQTNTLEMQLFVEFNYFSPPAQLYW